MRVLILFFCLLSYSAKGQFDDLTITLEINTSSDKRGAFRAVVQLSLFSIIDSSYEVKVEQYKIFRDRDFRLHQTKVLDTSFVIDRSRFNCVAKKVKELNSARLIDDFKTYIYTHPTTIRLTYGNVLEFVNFSFVYTKDRKQLENFFQTCKDILNVAGIRYLLD